MLRVAHDIRASGDSVNQKLQQALIDYNEAHPEAPLTQAALAEKVGTTQSLVNKHLKGRVVPGHLFIVKYAKVLGVTTDFLLDVHDTQGVA